MDYEEFASLQLDKPIPDIRVRNSESIIINRSIHKLKMPS